MKIGKSHILKEEFLKTLKTETTLILATCENDRVSIRPMSHINIGSLSKPSFDIYLQTSRDSLKVRQIMSNSNVAICIGTYQAEGSAYILGHPLDDKYAFFANAYKKKHPEAFNRYSSNPDEVIIKIVICHVSQWRYIDGKPFVAELNLAGV